MKLLLALAGGNAACALWAIAHLTNTADAVWPCVSIAWSVAACAVASIREIP